MSIREYQPDLVEPKWCAYWEKQKFFSSSPNKDKEPYVVIMPPPNITGVLHMGHKLNLTKQDILVRKARMSGKEACWVPGLDHASIATEARVTAMLKEQGIEKKNLSREAFLSHVWQWKEKYGDIILRQQRKLGISCDWEKLRFTMDSDSSKAVTQAFVSLYEQGYIYRGHRMVHWDPQGQTALADDEVIYKEVAGNFYHIKYPLVNHGDGFITVATTRPETLLGDVALCVHPEDARYQHLIGQHALVPLIHRKIPIIGEGYVDKKVGTGCLKVTPAHDPNDYRIGLKHDLPIIEILNQDGTLNERAQRYIGEDRFVARKKIIKDLEKENLLSKIVPHRHQVGFSERTHAVTEPRLSTQWFVKMQNLAEPALRSVQEGIIRFHPSKFKNIYNAWLKNVKDWCISRQLSWGHRIPSYYLQDGRYVIAADPEKALAKARILTGNPNLPPTALKQDEDVLDTWFSSWLWPITVFNGLTEEDNPYYQYYFPTHDLVTAPDIIFFWVARMIIASHVFTKQPPFKNVYFTGIVRDKQGKKMSKSLGNSPDPIALIKKYSADGLRAGMLFCTPAGNDLPFDEKLCLQGKRFIHKVWNALRLVKSWKVVKNQEAKQEKIAIHWFHARYQHTLHHIETSFQHFRLSEAFITIYKLIWNDFCAHYLEMVKPSASNDHFVTEDIHSATIAFFQKLIKLLHPFMPFITEEIWHQLRSANDQESITIAPWPQKEANVNHEILTHAKYAFDLITRVRHLKRIHHHPSKNSLSLSIEENIPRWVRLFDFYIRKKIKIKDITSHQKNEQKGIAFTIEKYKLSIPDIVPEAPNESKLTIQKQLDYQKGLLISIEKKLSNKQFLANAPQDVVAREHKKHEDTKGRITALEQLLSHCTEV